MKLQSVSFALVVVFAFAYAQNQITTISPAVRSSMLAELRRSIVEDRANIRNTQRRIENIRFNVIPSLAARIATLREQIGVNRTAIVEIRNMIRMQRTQIEDLQDNKLEFQRFIQEHRGMIERLRDQ